MPERSNAVLLLLVAIAIAVGDQMAKAAIIAAIGPAQPESRIAVGNGWVTLEYTQNTGAAFGLFPGLGPLLAVASIGIVAALLIWYFGVARPPIWLTAGTGAIVGGAAGNLVDRLRWGHVVDFVSIGPWPNFNVADSAVTLGVLALTWGWLRADSGTARSRAS